MRKILLIIGLFLTISLSGQILPGIVASQGGAGFVARSAEYDTVYKAMTTKPTAQYAVIDDDMVYSLDSAGFWDRMDYLLIVASENEDGALINWIKPGTYDADNVSSTAWTKFEGYTGDGANDYISTNFNLSSNTSNYTLDDASVGIYIRTNLQETTPTVFKASDGTNSVGLSPRTTTDQYSAKINASLNMGGIAVLDSRALWVLTRTASNACSMYRTTTKLETETDVSTSIPDTEIYVLYNITAPGYYSAHQFSIFFIMDGVSDDDVTNLNTIFERRMDRLGKGVQ